MGHSGKQEDEFGENALKSFQGTGGVIYVLNNVTLDTPKTITSNQFKCINVKYELLPQLKIPKYGQRHKQDNIRRECGSQINPRHASLH